MKTLLIAGVLAVGLAVTGCANGGAGWIATIQTKLLEGTAKAKAEAEQIRDAYVVPFYNTACDLTQPVRPIFAAFMNASPKIERQYRSPCGPKKAGG